MATDITVIEQTPLLLKYSFRSTDNSHPGREEILVQQSDMVTQALSGPLKALLSQTYTSAQWFALVGSSANQTKGSLSILATTEGNDGIASMLTVPCSANLTHSAPFNYLRVAMQRLASDASLIGCVVEVRFQHSLTR